MAITQRNESHSTWSIDPSKTSAEFSVKVFGVQTVRGRFHEVIGTVDGDEDDPTTALAEVTINATSIDTKLKMRDRHLRTADFLDAEHYPTITFKSTHVEQIGED